MAATDGGGPGPPGPPPSAFAGLTGADAPVGGGRGALG
ncbi:hypothetical protein KCH_29280 [Kitasatospora cheerisanensis KCTC 2395]|uniref:Uncharacterized protein n=1 Tax=Kitasatospora cheerisanensis KCTC 2395 TaxID=1348663 RepID=A0A066YVT5_9ACTN|nr:hypothetical protein KCH_29280 [Kitasatospora cheerisanensis KCTC 2395]